ncbi:MAG: cell division topological specificity factor MinE [Alphaproteobacteria bacterium]|nr:cell division topological specificity factor MinE [Alphaproteobacteria bacterium]
MRLFDFFRSRRTPAAAPPAPPAATVAKERLQILLAHERADRGSRAEFLPALQKEILDVVAKYLVIDPDKVMVKLDRGKDISVLEVNVELPGPDVQLLQPIKPVVVEKLAEAAAEADKKSDEKVAEKPVEKQEAPAAANAAGPLAHSAA